MMRGFLAFALCAVFLLALVASGSLLSSYQPGNSFQKYRALQVEDLAVKKAIYSAVSEAAKTAADAAQAAGSDSYPAAVAAVRGRLSGLGQLFSASGYEVQIWCGSPSEGSLKEASVQMTSQGAPVIPQGASEISAQECLSAAGVGMLERKIHFSQVGFSAYFPSLGAGFASVLPSGYEVGF